MAEIEAEYTAIDDGSQASLDAQLKAINEIKKANEKAAEDQAKIDEETAKTQAELNQSKVDGAFNAASGIADLAEEGSAAQKSAATVAAGINVYEGITKALSAAPPPFNILLAAITAAQGFMTIKKITATPKPQKAKITKPKMEMGGYIYGPSHSGGGVDINAEGGEFVINKAAMRNPQIASTAIALNNGGRGGANMGLTDAQARQVALMIGSVPAVMVESQANEVKTKREIREGKYIF
jgi:hypothetical protein